MHGHCIDCDRSVCIKSAFTNLLLTLCRLVWMNIKHASCTWRMKRNLRLMDHPGERATCLLLLLDQWSVTLHIVCSILLLNLVRVEAWEDPCIDQSCISFVYIRLQTFFIKLISCSTSIYNHSVCRFWLLQWPEVLLQSKQTLLVQKQKKMA